MAVVLVVLLCWLYLGVRRVRLELEGQMQRTKEDLEGMNQAELVARVLELQDLLREGLEVRNTLHRVLNDILKVKADEVSRYADVSETALDPDECELKAAWARVRHAVANPSGAATMMPDIRGEDE